MTAPRVDPEFAELARLLARGYIRLLASRAEQEAVSSLENNRVSTPKPLDSWAETRPPCVAPEARRT